jgi:hypothetical protein
MRKLLKPERDRKARIRRIRRENFEIIRHSRGCYSMRLKINHQSFQLQESGFFDSRRHAEWTATQAAIALNRFKFGD